MGRDRRSIKEMRKGQWKRWAVRETGVWDTGQGAAAQLDSGTVSRRPLGRPSSGSLPVEMP